MLLQDIIGVMCSSNWSVKKSTPTETRYEFLEKYILAIFGSSRNLNMTDQQKILTYHRLRNMLGESNIKNSRINRGSEDLNNLILQ